MKLVTDRSKQRTRAMEQRKASTAADRQGGDSARASAAEPDKTTSPSTTQCDDEASQDSSASARSAANKNKGGNDDTGRGERHQEHVPGNSSPRQHQQGDIVLVDLDEAEAGDASMADVSDQGDPWLPAVQSGKRWLRSGKRWRRTSRGLTSSSEGGIMDDRAEHEADEAESHPAKASKAAQRDSGDKSTGQGPGARRRWRHVESQGDAGRVRRAKAKSK